MSGQAKWIVKDKNIPCAWYAMSCPCTSRTGSSVSSRHTTKSKFDGYWHAIATVKKGNGKLASTRMGASTFHDEKMSLAFACRNAIKWLLPQQPRGGKPSYKSTGFKSLDEAIAKQV